MDRWFLPAALGCLVALTAVVFGPVLVGGGQIAFRDAGSFYDPLQRRIQQEWEAGRWPLWEPEENGGVPLLGNPSAAVLYPGKLVYACLPFAWAARVYAIAHVFLAYAAMFALLRGWGVSRSGSVLGATAYGFGGPILFQVNNIIILVGAAWAPFGFRGADRWLRLGRRGGLAELAVALAMQVLGGDPEAAYLVVVAAGGYAVGLSLPWDRIERVGARVWIVLVSGAVTAWVAITLGVARWWATREVAARALRDPVAAGVPWVQVGVWALGALVVVALGRRGRDGGLLRRMVGLAGAAGLAGALAGVQLVPGLEFLSLSTRAGGDPTFQTDAFSLEPIRLAELAWPKVFGEALSNRDWVGLVPPRHMVDVWTPSLYLGGLVGVLALGSCEPRRGPSWRRWATALAIAGLLLSLGRFAGPLWVARFAPGAATAIGPHDAEVGGVLRGDPFPPDGLGSPYHLLATLLPGFGSFRYPAKLLTFASLGLAALAALGWDEVQAGRRRRAERGAAAVLMLGLLALLLTYVFESRLVAVWRSAPPPMLASPFGTFDPTGALGDTRRALFHGSLAALLAGLVVRASGRFPVGSNLAALLLLTADLIVAGRGLVPTVPQSLLDPGNTPEVLRRIEAAERATGESGPYRIYRMPNWHPQGWLGAPAGDRVSEMLAWERATIQPKYALPFGASYTAVESTLELADLFSFFNPFPGRHGPEVSRSVGLPPGELVVYYPRRGFDLWNTRYFVLPHAFSNDPWRGYASLLPETEVIDPPPSLFEGADGARRLARWRQDNDWLVLRNRAAYPRAWIVHQVRPVSLEAGKGPEERARRKAAVLRGLLYQADPFWNDPRLKPMNPHALAWVEAELQSITPRPDGGPPDPSESATVTEYTPQRVVIDVQLNRPGLVVLADVHYPGWRLTVDGRPAVILRTNRLMRGAAVAAGNHRLVYTYDPFSVKIGFFLTLLGIAALAGLVAWARRSVPPGDRR